MPAWDRAALGVQEQAALTEPCEQPCSQGMYRGLGYGRQFAIRGHSYCNSKPQQADAGSGFELLVSDVYSWGVAFTHPGLALAARMQPYVTSGVPMRLCVCAAAKAGLRLSCTHPRHRMQTGASHCSACVVVGCPQLDRIAAQAQWSGACFASRCIAHLQHTRDYDVLDGVLGDGGVAGGACFLGDCVPWGPMACPVMRYTHGHQVLMHVRSHALGSSWA
jgi:hypothetical protein